VILQPKIYAAKQRAAAQREAERELARQRKQQLVQQQKLLVQQQQQHVDEASVPGDSALILSSDGGACGNGVSTGTARATTGLVRGASLVCSLHHSRSLPLSLC
jgi:hypothetical protein